MKLVISKASDSTKANSFLLRMHKSMGNSIINIEKERLYREGSSQEKKNPPTPSSMLDIPTPGTT